MKVSMPMPMSPSLPAYREELLNFIQDNLIEETMSTSPTTSPSTTPISPSPTTLSTTTSSLTVIDSQGNCSCEEGTSQKCIN